MGQLVYPASGLLPVGAHFEAQREDQGKDFATNWRGVIQAPGDGYCLYVGSDAAFPNGFGPAYPVVRITSGPYGGHDWYIGHCTTRVRQGEHFTFGHPLAVADQGHNFNGTNGGWCEFGERLADGRLGPEAGSHWFDHLVLNPLVVNVPDKALKFNDSGVRVLLLTSRLKDCGYLPRRYWTFNRIVHGAVVAFKQHHKLPEPKVGDRGIVDHSVEVAVKRASAACKKSNKNEV